MEPHDRYGIYLRKTVSFLSKNYKESLNTPKKDLKTVLDKFMRFYDKANKKSKTYVYQLISKEPRPTNLYPDTIGSYLFGCQQRNYGSLPKRYSALCHSNIDGTGVSNHPVGIQLWIQKDKKTPRFRQMNNEISDTAYMFVNKNFDAFYKDEIDILIRNGVEKVFIFTTQYNIHLAYQPLEKIFQNEEMHMIPLKSLPVHHDTSDGDDTFRWNHSENKTRLNYTLFIIFAVVLILIFLIAYRRR